MNRFSRIILCFPYHTQEQPFSQRSFYKFWEYLFWAHSLEEKKKKVNCQIQWGWEICNIYIIFQFSSVAQSCLTHCDTMDCSTAGLPVHHQIPEFPQTHVHWVDDAIQPLHPLPPSPPALNLSQHQGLFQSVSSFHQVAKVLELQLQHQSFQWVLTVYFL